MRCIQHFGSASIHRVFRIAHHFGVQLHAAPGLLFWCFLILSLTMETASLTSLCFVPRMSTNGEACSSDTPKVSPNSSSLQSPGICDCECIKNFP
mmetsp:Transcript_13375/g.21992  ORF Transcript_13375/g.21992 Transcript_13375/m.21992 type:complete len:95 (+) Transcript_13375:31-315(+)